MTTHTCTNCGSTANLTSTNLESLHESLWSRVTDDVCDECWLLRYL